jgi:mono/diheme cytochrome c family protein
MSRLRRIVTRSLAGLFAIVLVLALTAYVGSERQLSRVWTVPAHSVAIPADSASVARGSHLVNAVGTCATCHGEDLGGKVYADMGPIGIVAGPNLTPGQGGRGATFTNDDWVRAIRFGVHRDSTSLIAMPSEVFMNMSDSDLGAVIAYLKQLAPIERTMPASRFRPLGRALLAAGKLKVLTAPKTPAKATVASVPQGVTPAYGRYLVEISGCAGCHGYGLSGGRVAGPPGIPPASNLTPAGIGAWHEQDLRRVLREGKKPDRSPIDPFMPWKTYAGMTDDEITAIWLYLRSVPAKPFGNK